jgi:hypothetical protein
VSWATQYADQLLGQSVKLRARGCFDTANRITEDAHQLLTQGDTCTHHGIVLSLDERRALSRTDCYQWDGLRDEGEQLEWPRPFGPRRDGSSRCQSGSIASGGTKTYCTCNTCF